MTKSEWQVCAEPGKLRLFVSDKLSPRKRLLIYSAWSRCCSDCAPDRRTLIAIEVAEQFADRLATPEDFNSAGCEAVALRVPILEGPHYESKHPEMARLLRDIVGNPFHQVVAEPARRDWNNRTPWKLAQAIYRDECFDQMPILGDALEDAGCDNADILDHCRSGADHVRGCWVVDLLLGKE